MFENKLIGDIYASRFIMSWVRSGGKLKINGEGYYEFEKWLKSFNLSEEEISDITFLAKNGKFELEISAKRFIAVQ